MVLAVWIAAVSQGADLQITCDPGIRIYVDGEFRGVSQAEQDGLYLTELATGSHVVTFRKRGFRDRAEIVRFRTHRAVKEVVVETLAPQVSARVEVSTRLVRLEAETGAIDVRCIPAHCEVEVAEHRIELAGGIAKFNNVPAGPLRLIVGREDVRLVTEILLQPDAHRRLLADFARSRILDDVTGAVLSAEVLRDSPEAEGAP
ncbi:MAG: hypothetical protein AAGA48_09605 [Myxococcota bacterium]